MREAVAEDLHAVMSREVQVMREVLANMHAEQHAILQKDKISQLMLSEDRAHLIKDMHTLREQILDNMEKYDANVPPSSSSSIVDSVQEDSQFLSLKDQILSLVQKIHEQYRHNRSLQTCHCYYPQPEVKEKKMKIGLMTLDKRSKNSVN